MVRSDEKKPQPAVDIIDISVHLAVFLYVSSTRACNSVSTLHCLLAHMT